MPHGGNDLSGPKELSNAFDYYNIIIFKLFSSQTQRIRSTGGIRHTRSRIHARKLEAKVIRLGAAGVEVRELTSRDIQTSQGTRMPRVWGENLCCFG